MEKVLEERDCLLASFVCLFVYLLVYWTGIICLFISKTTFFLLQSVSQILVPPATSSLGLNPEPHICWAGVLLLSYSLRFFFFKLLLHDKVSLSCPGWP